MNADYFSWVENEDGPEFDFEDCLESDSDGGHFEMFHHLNHYRSVVAQAAAGVPAAKAWLEECAKHAGFDTAYEVLVDLMGNSHMDDVVLWLVVERLQQELPSRFGHLENGGHGKFFVYGPWAEKPWDQRSSVIEVGTIWGTPHDLADFNLTIPQFGGSYRINVSSRVDIPDEHVVIPARF